MWQLSQPQPSRRAHPTVTVGSPRPGVELLHPLGSLMTKPDGFGRLVVYDFGGQLGTYEIAGHYMLYFWKGIVRREFQPAQYLGKLAKTGP